MRSRLLASGLSIIGFAAFMLPLAPANAQSVAVSVQNVTPGTVLSAGTTATFDVVAAGFTNPTYAVSDSFSGSSITSADINSSGVFTWTPQSSDQGTHNVTVTISDSMGHVASVQVQFTVASAYVTLGSPTPGTSVAAGTTVSFYASVTGFSSPSFALNDSFSGGSLSSSDINSSGFFSWTPTAADVGPHTITVLAFDSSGHSASASIGLTVLAGTSISLSSVSPSSAVAPGTLVSFTASAANFSNPNFTVSDSFSGTSVSSGDISSSGDFTWTPQASDIGTHTLTVTGYDTQGHTGTAQVVITVGASGSVSTATTPVVTTTTSAPAPAYTFTEYLSPGSQDNEVLMLQELLAREGYLTAAPTGYFGVATEDAVMKFQTANNLDSIGVVGPGTRAALNALEQTLASSSGTLSTTSSSPSTSQLQQEVTTIEQLLAQVQSELQKIQAGQ